MAAALDQRIAEDLKPAIEDARRTVDSARGLSHLIEAAISLGAREQNLLIATQRAGSLTADISDSLNEALNELVYRGQQDGVIRADLVAEDIPRIIGLLYSVLSTMEPNSDGWRRYVALMLDAISTNERQPLPRRRPFVDSSQTTGPCEALVDRHPGVDLELQSRHISGLIG